MGRSGISGFRGGRVRVVLRVDPVAGHPRVLAHVKVHLEANVFAIVAAFVFGLALLLDLADYSSQVLNLEWLGVLGLLLLALHLAGVGSSFNWRSRRSYRRSRR
jgi:hypothetical protein